MGKHLEAMQGKTAVSPIRGERTVVSSMGLIGHRSRSCRRRIEFAILGPFDARAAMSGALPLRSEMETAR
jgi:hypothetical protein